MSVAPEVLDEVQGELHLVTREEYDRAIQLGAYEDLKVELLEGMIVDVSPEGPDHHWIVGELAELLIRSLPLELKARIGGPFAASDVSEPEPDICVIHRSEHTPTRHPSSLLLAIESSKSSRRKDLGIKARIYAAAGVPEYWVIDLVKQVTHVHTQPTGDAYASVEQHPFADTFDACGVPVCIAALIDG